jgi:hypothetical protein
MSHDCPGPGCERQVPSSQLACSRHWYQVPEPLRQAVYRAWNRGKGTGTAEHRQAMLAAVDTMRPL